MLRIGCSEQFAGDDSECFQAESVRGIGVLLGRFGMTHGGLYANCFSGNGRFHNRHLSQHLLAPSVPSPSLLESLGYAPLAIVLAIAEDDGVSHPAWQGVGVGCLVTEANGTFNFLLISWR